MENRWEERKKHLDETKRGDVIKGGWKNSTGREVLSNSMGKQVERTTEMKCTQQIPNYRAQNTTNTVTLKLRTGRQTRPHRNTASWRDGKDPWNKR